MLHLSTGHLLANGHSQETPSPGLAGHSEKPNGAPGQTASIGGGDAERALGFDAVFALAAERRSIDAQPTGDQSVDVDAKADAPVNIAETPDGESAEGDVQDAEPLDESDATGPAGLRSGDDHLSVEIPDEPLKVPPDSLQQDIESEIGTVTGKSAEIRGQVGGNVTAQSSHSRTASDSQSGAGTKSPARYAGAAALAVEAALPPRPVGDRSLVGDTARAAVSSPPQVMTQGIEQPLVPPMPKAPAEVGQRSDNFLDMPAAALDRGPGAALPRPVQGPGAAPLHRQNPDTASVPASERSFVSPSAGPMAGNIAGDNLALSQARPVPAGRDGPVPHEGRVLPTAAVGATVPNTDRAAAVPSAVPVDLPLRAEASRSDSGMPSSAPDIRQAIRHIPEPSGTTSAIAPNPVPERRERVLPTEHHAPVAPQRAAMPMPAPAAAQGPSVAAPAAGTQIAPDPAAEREQVTWQSDRLAFSGPVTSAEGVARGPLGAMPGPAEMPRHVARQIVAAARAGSDRAAELTLSPAELGRVRISLVTGEAGVTVSIVADRPETLDLLRRHADQLAQDFREIGYDSAEFQFGQNTPGGSGAGAAQTDRETPAPAKPSGTDGLEGDRAHLAARPPGLSLDHVDIRL